MQSWMLFEKNPYPHAEDRGLVVRVFSSAARLPAFDKSSADPWALRPRVAPGLLFSENTFLTKNQVIRIDSGFEQFISINTA